MFKIVSLLVLSFLFINTQTLCAKEVKDVKNPKQVTDAVQKNQAMDGESAAASDLEDDFDFSEKSFYISDEQLEDAKKIDEIDDKSGFKAKIINSSHFSSGTATRTYIPINKVK